MSRLSEMIKELCPDGVEYRKLGEVCNLVAGGDVPKNRFSEHITDEYSVPVYSNGVEEKSLYGYTDIPAITEPCVTISARGTIGYAALRIKPFFPIIRLICVIPDESINVRFLLHVLKMSTFRSPQTGIPQLTIPMVKKHLVPVPPLPIQNEIVKMLDNFTELTAELTAELVLRKKQYNFYRDALLTFARAKDTIVQTDRQTDRQTVLRISKIRAFCREFTVEYRCLGDIAAFRYGYTAKATSIGNARYIRITDITDDGGLNPLDARYIDVSAENRDYILKRGDLVMARTGATYGKTLYYNSDVTAIYASFLIKIQLDETKIIPRFYWHYTKTSEYWGQANKLVAKGGQPQFNTGAISRVNIPIPPLEVQAKIVSILDRFDALTSDLTQGLPAEIAARRKQYEYYRDKLLTFHRKGA